MGVTFNDAEMYFSAKIQGTSFKSLIVLGRQRLYLHKRELRILRQVYADRFGNPPTSLARYNWGDFADEFFCDFLGTEKLTVIDASPYEGADIIHDMNRSVSSEMEKKFDAVIDCGSLEHIFNVPVALKNLASMVRIGGAIFITTPANNMMGHGFYQFSPELMFRVFSEQNGFCLRNLMLCEARFPGVELSQNRTLYYVTDPQQVHKRVGLLSKRPAVMMVEALRSEDAEMFAVMPLQSDYLVAWADDLDVQPRSASAVRSCLGRTLNLLPYGLRSEVLGRYQRRNYSLRNRLFYRRVR